DNFALFVAVLDLLELETFPLKSATNTKVALRVIAEFLEHLLVMLVPDVADIFQEEQREDVILVLFRVDDTAKRVARRPYRIVDVFWFGHGVVPMRRF